jgi:hypothetical protein
MSIQTRLARKLVRQILCVLTVSVLCCFQLRAQSGTLKSNLEKELVSRVLVSKIVIGGKGIPPGYSGAYPINTLIYPDKNNVVYRVEWGLIRGEAGPNMERFNRGTSFRVTAVELKDDLLELKLQCLSGGSANLKLMLGAGWQTKFDVSFVQVQLARVFVLDEPLQPTHSTEVVDGSKTPPTSVNGVAPNEYQRAPNASGQQAQVSTPERRRDWAAKATADPRMANKCLYKTAGEQDEVLLIMCPGTTDQAVERLLADAQYGQSMFRVGFRTVIYSDGTKNFWGADYTEAGYVRLPDGKTKDTSKLFLPNTGNAAQQPQETTSSGNPEPSLGLALYEQGLESLKPWPREGQQIYNNYVISKDSDFRVAVALFTDPKIAGSFWVELNILNQTHTATPFEIQYVILTDANNSQGYVWDKHIMAELGWNGWPSAFYWADSSIAPDSSNGGIFSSSLSPGTIGWRGSTSQLVLPMKLRVPIGRKAYEFVFDTSTHVGTYVTPQLPAPAPIAPHKVSGVEWNGVHIGSPLNDPAIKASGCTYMGEGGAEFSKALLALSSGAITRVCRLIADCPQPSDSPVKVCSEDVSHSWISQIWVFDRQSYSVERAALEIKYGKPLPGLYRAVSSETGPPSYNVWQIPDGTKILAKQDSLGSVTQNVPNGGNTQVSVVFIISQ